MNLQLHCTRPALSQYCKIFKGLQRDEKIAKFTSTYNKMERMATNKRRKADTCQKTAKTSKRTNQKKTKSLTFTTTSNAPLAPLHRLHKTQFNTISTETVATETRETTITFTAGTVNRNFFKQKRHGYRAFWCDFQKNCQADKNRVVTVCPVT